MVGTGWCVIRMQGGSLRVWQGVQITFGSLVGGGTLAAWCFFSSASIADLNLMNLLICKYFLLKAVPEMSDS